MNGQRNIAWSLPDDPWVLHATEQLGVLTERWIQTQLDSQRRFGGRLVGYKVAPQGVRRENWLVAHERLDRGLSYVAMLKAGGLGGGLIARKFRASPPAVLHAHFGVVAAPSVTLASSLRSPLVASFYGYDASMDRLVSSVVWRRRYRRLFHEVAAVLVEGPSMAERVARLGCPQRLLRIVRLPADAVALEAVVRRPSDTFEVVAAGRFVGKKGFDTGMRAFARGLRGGDARLLMVGGGPLEPEYRRLAHDLGIAGQVTWLGSLPFREFMARIARASVAVFPSRPAPDGDTEGGAPVTLIETQWLGVPVLVSDHDDLPFVASPGSTVLPPTDIDAWAEALNSLRDSPSLLDRMGAEGAAFARANHSPEGNARARESIYAEFAASVAIEERSFARA